jgi:hypothetical protein
LGKSDASVPEQSDRVFAEHVSAFTQNHSRSMAEENGQRLRFFFSAQMNDDLHRICLFNSMTLMPWKNNLKIRLRRMNDAGKMKVDNPKRMGFLMAAASESLSDFIWPNARRKDPRFARRGSRHQ